MNEAAFGKIFESLYSGSMIGAGEHVFALWPYCIAHVRPPGMVEVNPKLVGAIIGTTAENVQTALDYLCAPDPSSRSTKEEGRRLVREGQFNYRMVNFSEYRERMSVQAKADYMRDYRAQGRDKSRPLVKSGKSRKHLVTPVREAEAEAEAEKKVRTPSLEEVKLTVSKIGLPESDAVWFWNKCEGNGWTNNGKRMKSWPHVIAAWKAAGYMASQRNHPVKAPDPENDWRQSL